MSNSLSHILAVFTLISGCAGPQWKNVEIEKIAQPSVAVPSISTIVVDKSLPDLFILPYASGPDVGSPSSTVEKARIRGKQGMAIGAIPGIFLHGGRNTAKGEILSVALLLAGASVGGIAGGTVGIVEGGAQDLMGVITRLRDDNYTDEDVQKVYGALRTREILAQQLRQLTNSKPPKPISVLSELENPLLADTEKMATDGTLRVRVFQIYFLPHLSAAETTYEFVLIVRAEVEGRIGDDSSITQFTYRSKGRTQAEWAEGGAALLRGEHAQGCSQIAEKISSTL